MGYDGKEKRHDYCPVHNIKCDEIKAIDASNKKRVPIWVFVIFISSLSFVIGYQLTLLSIHITESTKVLKSLSHGLNEVALNQKRMLGKIGMEFQELPHYDR